MQDLARLSNLIFENEKITDVLVIQIFRNHIAKMEQNNSTKIYSSIIEESKTLLDSFEKQYSAVDVSVVSRISKTKNLDQLISTLKKEVRKYEANIRVYFDKKSPQYLDNFPFGLSEYNTASKSNLEALINRLVEKSDKYKETLTDKFFNSFKTLQTDYITFRNDQINQKGEVGVLKKDKSDSRNSVNIQLQKNIFTILINNIGTPNILYQFFDISLLPKNKSVQKSEIVIEGTNQK